MWSLGNQVKKAKRGQAFIHLPVSPSTSSFSHSFIQQAWFRCSLHASHQDRGTFPRCSRVA